MSGLEKLAAGFIFMSVLLAGWIGYELGMFGWTPGIASEPAVAEAKAPAVSDSGAAESPADETKAAEKPQPSAAREEGGLDSLNRSLEKRAKELDAREAEILRRERQVLDKETVFTQQLDRYEKILQELKTRVAQLERVNQQQVDGFKKLYEKMDPKKVAKILEATEMSLAAEIIGDMKPSFAAEVMGKMSNDRVRALTEKYLAKRAQVSARKPTSSREAGGGGESAK